MKVSKNFYVQEFVHPVYMSTFKRSAGWYVSQWQIETAEFVRSFFGHKSMTINDYLWGGILKNRGTRPPNSQVGSYYSQHKMAMAIDFNIEGYAAEDLYNAIIDNQKQFIKRGITTIESLKYTPTWIHLDGRITGNKKMNVVAPKLIKGWDADSEKYLIDL